MDRDRLLDQVLCLVVEQRSAEAVALAEEAGDPAMAGFAAFMAGDHARAVLFAGRKDVGTDAIARGFSRAVRALAAATASEATLGDPFDGLAAVVETVPTDDRVGAFVRYLAVEASLAAARLDLAQQVRPGGPPVYGLWVGHPYAAVMLACEARLDTFSGRIDQARTLLAEHSGQDVAGDLVRATAALAAGNAADVTTMRRLVAEVEAAGVEPTDHLGRGVHLLLAFAVIALGDTSGAVRHLLRAGGDADLTALTVVDRGLAYELLVAASVDEGDLDAARSWLERGGPADVHRAAAPPLERARARVALLAGEPALAITHACQAIDLARTDGRAIEVAEGEILLARARIAADEVPAASRSLREAVTTSDRTGHRAMRHSASRTLRSAGRRLPPVTGAGPGGLTARESEVADLILAGLGNDEIALRLHLSPATVRAHCSRILTAYGVGTRIGLLAAVLPWPQAPDDPDDLTPQQRRVARLVSRAHTNQQIADELGISTKGVEKHVSDILTRWDLTSRFDLARLWWDRQT